eukprot:11422565-Prorocentrum_lima.AAC.1
MDSARAARHGRLGQLHRNTGLAEGHVGTERRSTSFWHEVESLFAGDRLSARSHISTYMAQV